MRSTSCIVGLAVSIVAALAGLARAQEGGADDSQVTPLVVPDIPALTALGTTSSEIDRPGSTSEVGAALANIYQDGAIQSGVAVEVNLRAFGVGKRTRYPEYRRSSWQRALAHSALSFGTASASAADPTMPDDIRAAFGARIVLFDDADPLLAKPYRDAAAYAREQCPGTVDDAAVTACRTKALEEYNSWTAPAWNSSGAFVAAALIERFGGAELGNHTFEGGRVWGAYGRGFGENFHVAAGVTWTAIRHGKDDVSVATRLRYGNARFRGTVDGEWYPVAADDAADGRIGIGLELQVTDTTWLTATAATDVGVPGVDAKVELLSSLKWGMASDPSL